MSNEANSVKWQAVVSRKVPGKKGLMFRAVSGSKSHVLDAVCGFIQQGFDVFAGPSIRRAGVWVTDRVAREAVNS